jgi:hypothetical protein
MKTVQCSCGYVASGETAEKLLAAVETHIDAEHDRLRPEQGGHHAEAQDQDDVALARSPRDGRGSRGRRRTR